MTLWISERTIAMSKLNNLKAETYLAVFKNTMGVHFPKVCADINSWIGQRESTIVSKQSGWTVGTKGRLVSKDGHTLQLDLNAAWTPLVLFGMQLSAINTNGSTVDNSGKVVYDMDVQADIPAASKSWYETHYINAKSAKTEEVSA